MKTLTPERLGKFRRVLDKRQPDLTVVLDNVQDPHNISAVLRTCDAVGIQEVYVLDTRVRNVKAQGWRSSRSATKWVTVHEFTDRGQCLQAVRQKYQRILTTHLSADSVSLYDATLTDSIALVFGNEKTGLAAEWLAEADQNIVIPQVGMLHSLNISVACGVTLYEALRQRQVAGLYNETRLGSQAYHTLLEEWSHKRKSNL